MSLKLSCLAFRAAETSQDVESLRPPRFIHEDGVIRPYKEREGVGSQMLQVLHKYFYIISPLLDLGKTAMRGENPNSCHTFFISIFSCYRFNAELN